MPLLMATKEVKKDVDHQQICVNCILSDEINQVRVVSWKQNLAFMYNTIAEIAHILLFVVFLSGLWEYGQPYY